MNALPTSGLYRIVVSRKLERRYRLRVSLMDPHDPIFDPGIKSCVRGRNCAEGTLECGSGSYRLCAVNSKAAALLPHSMAPRAFRWFLGARQPAGMSDCLENTQGEIPRCARNDSLGVVIGIRPADPCRVGYRRAWIVERGCVQQEWLMRWERAGEQLASGREAVRPGGCAGAS